jgi:NADH-quinone oxidoreductase subunit F
LKRFITDRVDPATFVPLRRAANEVNEASVAIVGAGPSGLTTAHYLSLMGYSVTVYESDNEPGGMLNSAIPSYRLPKTTLRKEVKSILDSNISLKCGKTLGRDFTLGELFREGHSAVFIAIGAHKSKGLGEGMDDELEGVIPALTYLKRFNLEGANLAKGNVGVIGGGDSAVDAARVARRQPEVESVTIYYRRTREEMPAFKEEIEAALAEGVRLETLVSPVSLEGSENGKSKSSGMKRLAAVNFVKNKLGEVDASGRRRPMPIVGSDFSVKLDSLLVAIGDEPDSDALAGAGVKIGKAGVIAVDLATLSTNIPGVFAGGDAVTGSNTVVEAIAAGKRAAAMIDRYIRGIEMAIPAEVNLPSVYVAPVEIDEEEDGGRQKPPVLSAERRVSSFMEIEGAYEPDCAKHEARRCLRCDLDFTRPTPAADEEDALLQTVEKV